MVDKLARIVQNYIRINIHLYWNCEAILWTIGAKMSIYDPLTKIPENVRHVNSHMYTNWTLRTHLSKWLKYTYIYLSIYR